MRTEERVKGRGRRSKALEGSEALTVQVVVQEPAGPHNLYEYDHRHQALRLSGVAVRDAASPWERGHIINTRTGRGQPLPALILVRIPTSPGCLVQARVLGAAEFILDGERQYLVVGVPELDHGYREIEDVGYLSRDLREAAEGWTSGFRRWLQVEETRAVIREATEAHWEARARAESGVRAGAVWKVPAPPRGAGERGEADPHNWAEYLVASLPMRFQRYVEEMLLPEERILFFVERPEFAPPGRLALFRSQKLRQGLLVITDRQVLTMLDSLPPDSTMVDWGYIAKATAVERIESAWADGRDSTAQFNLAVCAQGGTERYTLLFPGDHKGALEEAARLLDAFARPGRTAIAKRYDGAPHDDGWVGRHDLLARYPHLEKLIKQAGEEDVLAAAAARGPEGRGLGPALVVTPTRAIVFAGARSKKDMIQGHVIPIASISSVEAVQSVIACRLDMFLPDGEEVDKVTMKYDYPDSPAFIHAFITLRHLLGRPLTIADEC